MMKLESTAVMLEQRGLTFIELAVTIVLLAILLVLGFPSLHELIKNNQVASQNNELMALISLAKSEAIRRNREVTLQLSATDAEWEAFVIDPDGEDEIEGCALGVLRCANHDRVVLVGPGELTFNNRGYLTDFATANISLTHQDCNGNRQRRLIQVLGTGQIASCSTGCTAIDCL